MIEEFSCGYWLVDADIVPFNGDEVTTTHELGREMLGYTSMPLLKIDGKHRRVTTEEAIPANVIAVPHEIEPEQDDHVLLAKQETAQRLMDAGQA